ncbi:MAG: SMI1/KNR4 family protein, partial [Aeriscardovia sp.]|nr:SMI1/KNR4 family protein [Aeriscardovia sp.]
MQMKLNDSGEKITSEEIRSFEQDFSIVLPEDYKSFLEES